MSRLQNRLLICKHLLKVKKVSDVSVEVIHTNLTCIDLLSIDKNFFYVTIIDL